MNPAKPPILVLIVGPGAVGKMTVGAELAARTGLKLFHNHQTIDLLLHYFPFGSEPFGRLLGEFRRRILDHDYARQIPLGINVESVSIKRDEIDASVDLFRALDDVVRERLRPGD